MAFIDSLRKRNLFDDNNPNPFGPPQFNPRINVADAVNQAMQLRQSERDDARNFAQKQQNIQSGLMFGKQPQINAIAARAAEPNVVFDRRGDSADTFAQNILNPPERGFKFQDLAQKRDLAERGLDIKAGDQDIKQQRADTTQYSAETRRQLADLHNMSDSDKLKLLQEGRVTLQHLKDAAELNAIGARGEESRKTEGVKNTNVLSQIGARGEQTRQTNEAKPGQELAPTQLNAQQKIAARELFNTRPDLNKYIKIEDNGNFTIDPKTPINELSLIKAAIYPKGDVKLPADKNKKPATKDNDPLGIRK